MKANNRFLFYMPLLQIPPLNIFQINALLYYTDFYSKQLSITEVDAYSNFT